MVPKRSRILESAVETIEWECFVPLELPMPNSLPETELIDSDAEPLLAMVLQSLCLYWKESHIQQSVVVAVEK